MYKSDIESILLVNLYLIQFSDNDLKRNVIRKYLTKEVNKTLNFKTNEDKLDNRTINR